MPLVKLGLSVNGDTLPGDVRSFLREADRRIERFQRDCHVPGFVPSDFARVYQTLRALAAGKASPGNLFCEWGSGFGVVACLAAMLDFDARGIEIDEELVAAAQQLAGDFDLPVEFVRGSFIPAQSEDCIAADHEYSWLATQTNSGQDDQELGPADFDVIFAYPWPDEESTVGTLFERHASAGAVLVTYHGGEEIQLRRKTARRR
jgi:hypothetical protein